jgi:hypothetical protein
MFDAFAGKLEQREDWDHILREAVGYYAFANLAGKSHALTAFAAILVETARRCPGPRLQTAALVIASNTLSNSESSARDSRNKAAEASSGACRDLRITHCRAFGVVLVSLDKPEDVLRRYKPSLPRVRAILPIVAKNEIAGG